MNEQLLNNQIDNNINESPLKEYYDLTFDNSILLEIKKNKGVLRDIDYSNEYLIFKTPSTIKYLKNDGSIMNLSHKYYCYYIEVNQKTGVNSIKKMVGNFFMVFNENEGKIDEEKSKDNLRIKVTYDLAQKEKKWKSGKLIDMQSIKADPVDKGLDLFEIEFTTKNGKTVIKKVKADDKQISNMATYILKKNIKKFNGIKRILKVDFAKTFWAKIFFNTQKRKIMNLKELQSFTYKLYKIYNSKPSSSFPMALNELIRTTSGNLRMTAIELHDITEKDGLVNSYECMNRLNQIDIAQGRNPNFDEIYIAMIKLSSGLDMANIFFNLSELIERRVFLRRSVKSAMKKPVFTFIFLLGVAVIAVKSFAPVLKEIYEGMGKIPPQFTMKFDSAIDWVYFNIVFVILFIYIVFVGYGYFSKYTFYGKKAIHNIFLSIPLFGGFFRRSEYEILLSVSKDLYAGSKGHGEVLPIIQSTLENYHIKGVINTAASYFRDFNVNPGKVFDKYPEYIEPRVSNLFKPEKMDTSDGGDIEQLKNNYRLDNDEFIHNLQGILSTIMLIFSIILLLGIMFATIVPMIRLGNDLG